MIPTVLSFVDLSPTPLYLFPFLDKLPLPEIFQSGAAAQSTGEFMHSMDMYNQGMGISSSAALGLSGGGMNSSYDMHHGPSTTGGIGRYPLTIGPIVTTLSIFFFSDTK